VADQANLPVRRVMVEDGLHVAHVLGEIVGAVQPLRRAETAPVGGDDVPVALQFVDDELEGGGNIHPAMQQEQGGASGLPQRRMCRRTSGRSR
jgi:hypothetical protein